MRTRNEVQLLEVGLGGELSTPTAVMAGCTGARILETLAMFCVSFFFTIADEAATYA